MMNVAPETLAFGPQHLARFGSASGAIPFKPGESVVVAANEYPSNLYPWMAQNYRGVTTRRIPPRENGIVSEDDLLRACEEPGTRVLAVSWVQWGTGQKMDLEHLGTFCRERGILLVVDAVQGLGALRLDLANLPVDIATAGCHKWLLTPGGLGVLYVRPEVFASLLPINIGWNSVENALQWDKMQFDSLKANATRFEEGTPNLLSTAAFGASVTLLEAVGIDAIEERVLALADYTRDALRRRGDITLISPEGAGQKSGIVAFRHVTLPNETVLDALTAQNVVTVIRCGNLRFSPHAYNSEGDIDRAVAAIPAAGGGA